MKISDVLEVDLISNKIAGSDKEEVLNNMIELVSKSPKVRDKEKIRDAIFNVNGRGEGFRNSSRKNRRNNRHGSRLWYNRNRDQF